jgi:hypothetical protein
MNRSRLLPNYFLWLLGLLSLVLLALLPGARPVSAVQEFTLDWAQIGFVDSTSTLQTFENIGGSGVTMTTEFVVLDENFNELGIYVPGTGPLNAEKPKASGGALEVRDISQTVFPNAGYIKSRIIFSQDIYIKDLWMEPYYYREDVNVMKHAALQAFKGDGVGVVPISWTPYSSGPLISDLISQPHPGNGELWLRSDFPIEQSSYSGAFDINYGNQPVRELYWYSWGEDPDTGEFRHVLGSTLLGPFTFTLQPTAVTLQSFSPAASNTPVIALVGFLSLAIVAFGLIIVRRERRS